MSEQITQVLPFPTATGETGTPVIHKGIDTKSSIRRRMANTTGGGDDGGDTFARIVALESGMTNLQVDFSSIKTDITWIKRIGAGIIFLIISFSAWAALEIISIEKKELESENHQLQKDYEINLKLQQVLERLPQKH
jgi:hypothetical protein